MMPKQVLGLQWRLSAIYLAAGLLSTLLVGLGFLAGTAYGLEPAQALGLGLGAGLLGGLAASVWGFRLARQMKHRLWDAGDLALRIGRGDLGARLVVGEPDEIGQLEAQLNQMADHLEQAVGQLSRLAEQNRLLAEEAGRGAALEERARIARDLHDTVNQQLFVLSLRTAALRRRVEKAERERAAAGAEAAEAEATGALLAELAALEELARGAHSQTRELILQLRPTTLEQQGLGPALQEYVRTAAAREGWQVEGEIDTTVRLRGGQGEALFRVAQEALNNAAKHAKASRITVSLEQTSESVRLRVADDGVGFDPRKGVRPTAVGLVGMQERISALGGQLRIRSAIGQGTEIAVTLPTGEKRETDCAGEDREAGCAGEPARRT